MRMGSARDGSFFEVSFGTDRAELWGEGARQTAYGVRHRAEGARLTAQGARKWNKGIGYKA